MSTKDSRFADIVLWFTTIILLIVLCIPFSRAMSVTSVVMQDTLQPDLSVKEIIVINMRDNIQSNFTLVIPKNAYDVTINNEHVIANNDSVITTPLKCTVSCQVNISFSLNNVITKIDSSEFDYSRNLGLPEIPELLSYSILLPSGYYVKLDNTTNMDPSIVPKPSSINTNGRNIVIMWTERNPSLPKTYYLKYYSQDISQKEDEGFIRELQELPVLIMVIIMFIIGGILGFWISKKYFRKNVAAHSQSISHQANSVSVKIPASLLNPDEKAIIKTIKDNHNKLTQKEIGRSLEWSKSKTSAVMSNLEYKKIVEREKIGRNYKVKLIKDIEE